MLTQALRMLTCSSIGRLHQLGWSKTHHSCGPILHTLYVLANHRSRPKLVATGKPEVGLSRQKIAHSRGRVEVEGFTFSGRIDGERDSAVIDGCTYCLVAVAGVDSPVEQAGRCASSQTSGHWRQRKCLDDLSITIHPACQKIIVRKLRR